jgi:hypothetical protein
MLNSSDTSGLRPLEIEMIRAEARESGELKQRLSKTGGVLHIKTGDDWIIQQRYTPAARQLFGPFWHEHELCILFADTNMGKSVLAVQIGDSLARGNAIAPFGMQLSQPVNVLYIDFELSAMQFEQRYNDRQNNRFHRFGNQFLRAEYNPMASYAPAFRSYEEMLNNAMESAINRTHAQVLIIDNLTCLRTGTEMAADALPLMKHLNYLKTKFKISILVLAHTPKRKPGQPLTRNDLQGSKMLMNFCDSAFALGESILEKDQRYLKQIKQRSGHEVHGADNVCLCRMYQQEGFLQYVFDGYAAEHQHLQTPHTLPARAAQLAAEGLTQRQIATALKVSSTTVNRWLKEQDLHKAFKP